MAKLAILGASGHGKVVAELAELSGKWTSIVFFDDAWPQKKLLMQWPIIGDSGMLLLDHSRYQGVIVAIGNNKVRSQKLLQLLDMGADIVSLVHPTAMLSKYCSIGVGSVVCAGVVVNPDSIVGMGSILNTSATVDHDNKIGDFVHISPGAHLAGGVTVENHSWIGLGASLKQGITVGCAAIVGMGAVVVCDVPSNTTVVGNPARKLLKS